MRIEKYRCHALAELSPELGQTVLRPAGEPAFHTNILSYWDGIASWQISGKTGIGWFELEKRPFTGNEAERHSLTPEGLLCFQGAAVCLVGKPKESQALMPADFQSFSLETGQGIIFSPGVWHALPFPLTERAVFWVIFRQGTAQKDLEVVNLEMERGFQFEITL